MRRGRTTIAGIAAAIGAVLTVPGPAEAGCTRQIINRSAFTALVSRDGGPWVAIPPHRAQAIDYYQPGRLDVALVCAAPHRPAVLPDRVIYRGSFTYSAIIDRCYFTFGDHLPFHDQLGPGFFGTQETQPLTVNVPHQGDAVIGPLVEGSCPVVADEALRARY